MRVSHRLLLTRFFCFVSETIPERRRLAVALQDAIESDDSDDETGSLHAAYRSEGRSSAEVRRNYDV